MPSTIRRFISTASAIGQWVPSDYETIYQQDFAGDQFYYTPPINLQALDDLLDCHPQHGSLPQFFANAVLADYVENPYLSYELLEKIIIELCTFGGASVKLKRNKFGILLPDSENPISYLPHINIRRMPPFIDANGNRTPRFCYLNKTLIPSVFNPGEVFQWIFHSGRQQLYGRPWWFGGRKCVLLGESATDYPRRYFNNGAVSDYIVVTSKLGKDKSDELDAVLQGTTGEGNFTAMAIDFENGGKIDEQFKIVPIPNEGAKIDFTRFQDQSNSDVLKSWRVPPVMVGSNFEQGAATDINKVMLMFHTYEIKPLQRKLMSINRFLPGFAQLRFDDPYKTIIPVV